MTRSILILFVMVLAISCGTQQRINRSYKGIPVAILQEDLGIPSKIFVNQNDSVFVYEKTEELRSTEISQGKLTLDPIFTPSVIKTSRIYFTIKNGIVTNVRSEEEYER